MHFKSLKLVLLRFGGASLRVFGYVFCYSNVFFEIDLQNCNSCCSNSAVNSPVTATLPSQTPVASAMPVAIPLDMQATGWRFAWIAVVQAGILGDNADPEAQPDARIMPVTVHVRLHMYGGIFTDLDFASFAWRIFTGEVGDLPGADRSAACTLELAEAEGLLGNLGMSCWNLACGRRAPIMIPRSSRPRRDRRRRRQFQKCRVCYFAHYCSVECQRMQWRSHHREECAAIGAEYILGHLARRRAEGELQTKSAWGVGNAYKFCVWAHILEPQQAVFRSLRQPTPVPINEERASLAAAVGVIGIRATVASEKCVAHIARGNTAS